MPYNPGGLFSLVASYFASPGTTIRTEQHNPPLEDIASALSSVYVRDGRAPMTGPVNMNGFAINNVATGSTPGSVATLAQSMPIGAVIDYAFKTPPAGWLLCAAQILLANTPYQTVRTALINDGFPYGQDGSGNPKLPDAKGCVTAGYDSMGGTAAGRLTGDFGATVGVQSYMLPLSRLPNFAPVFTGILQNLSFTSSDSSFVRLGIAPGIQGGGGPVVVGQGTGAVTVSGNYQPLGSVASINGSQTQQLMSVVQPTLILNKIIKVSYDG